MQEVQYVSEKRCRSQIVVYFFLHNILKEIKLEVENRWLVTRDGKGMEWEQIWVQSKSNELEQVAWENSFVVLYCDYGGGYTNLYMG